MVVVVDDDVVMMKVKDEGKLEYLYNFEIKSQTTSNGILGHPKSDDELVRP